MRKGSPWLRKRKVTFEKFVKVKEIFERIENMSD